MARIELHGCFIRCFSFPFLRKILTKHNEWNRTPVVVRVARRFMPRLETESEVVAIEYLRRYTNVPCPKSFGLRFESLEWVRWGMHHRKRFCKEFIQFILIGSRNSDGLTPTSQRSSSLCSLIDSAESGLYLNTTYTNQNLQTSLLCPYHPYSLFPTNPRIQQINRDPSSYLSTCEISSISILEN